MQVTVEQLDPCKTLLNIEVDAETVGKAIEDVYRDYQKHTAIPGFRKGKTPRHLLERYVDTEKVKQMAIDAMVGPAYYEAIKQEEINPYDDPEVEIVEYEPGQPFKFKANVPLPPKVELGDYKGIEVERRKVEITDEDVESQLKYIVDSRTTTEKVDDRGVEATDIVIADMSSWPKGEERQEGRRSLIHMGSNIPGFDENVLGLKAGERKQFEITYPADYSEVETAGKTFEFDVAVEGIRAKIVPELNDEFAKSVSAFETVDALKEDIKKHLIESANDAADKEVEHKIIDEIVNRSTICFPEVMLNHEIQHDVQDLKEKLDRQGMTIDMYLKRMSKTQDEFIEQLKDEASQRLRIGLVLGDVADAEKLTVTDEDVEAEIDRIAEVSSTEENPVTRESVSEYVEAHGGRISVKNSLFNKKIMDSLKSVSVIKE